jgi:hypothetical protein
MCTDIDEPLRQCFKESGSADKQMKEKLEKKDHAFTWQKQQ